MAERHRPVSSTIRAYPDGYINLQNYAQGRFAMVPIICLFDHQHYELLFELDTMGA